MDMTLFGAGPTAPGGNSYFYNYFPTAPTNGSDYNAWGGPSIITTPRTSGGGGGGGGNGSKQHSEFYYPMTDGYTHYIGTDIVGGNTNGDGRLNAGQQSTNLQFGYLEQSMNRVSIYDDGVIPGVPPRTGQNLSSGPYGGGVGGGGGSVGVGPIVGHPANVGGGVVGATVGTGSTLIQNSASSGEPKKKSWATIASQPAKPNSGGITGIGGPLPGASGKARGRVPIGGVPGSASTDSGGGGTPNAVESGGTSFWNSSAVQPAPTKQDVTPTPTGNGSHSQRSYGGGLVKNASAGNGWTTSNSSAGKPTSNVDGGGIQSPATIQNVASNGGGKSESENGDSNNVVESSGNDSAKSNLEKNDSQQQKQQRNFFDKATLENDYNPKEFALPTKGARYFVIKSYSEDDIHRSIKYGIWCSTEHGNKRLDAAYREREGKGPIFLLFSVNGSGHFCGVAQMTSPLDYNKSSGVWAQDKWKGQFTVKWIYVKDVPNAQLRHIRLENNENKPVTNSRDTQEVPPEKGRQVLKIIHQYRHTTSLFDDFGHYEKRQEEEDQRKVCSVLVGIFLDDGIRFVTPK